MEPWFSAPLSALEVEARRAAAEEGRFLPIDPAVVHYSQNADCNFQRILSRSSSHSSSDSPPPYPGNLKSSHPSQGRPAAGTMNRSSIHCFDNFLTVSNNNEEYFGCQSYWKGEHPQEYPNPPTNYSVVYNHSNNHEALWGKRPPHELQSGPTINVDCHKESSSSSSPSSAYNKTCFANVGSRPNSYTGGYAVIEQVFKPMYHNEDKKDTKTHPSSFQLLRDGKNQVSNLVPVSKLESSKSRKPRPEPYGLNSELGSQKVKRANQKRFPCPDCGRMFARAFNMETHRKTHIGYRPHHCPKCDKKFSRRHDLHRHLAAVHHEPAKPLAPSGVIGSRLNEVENKQEL